MKNSSLRPVALAVALASAAALMPASASAEVSADLTLSSMYLWRGMDISNSKPALSSTIQYDHESGFYAGTWFSSEGASGSYELDYFLGFAKSFGEFGIDVGYAKYLYPQVAGPISQSELGEYIVGLSYGDFGVTGYINDDPNANADYTYVSVDYSYEKFGFHYGMTSVTTAMGDYSDMNISYAVTDELTWTISSATGDAIAANSTMDDPLVMISYSVPLK